MHFINNKNTQIIALLIVHINAILQSSDKGLLKPFSDLLERPETFKDSFLPSIPHDEDFEILQQLKTEGTITYTCPKGHFYTIGNCQKPATVGKCPTCNSKIGGSGYKLAEGNQITNDMKEKVQHGYCIPDASKRNETPESIRNIGSLNTIIIRLLLDCTLYISSLYSDRASVLLGANYRHNVSQYFADHIVKDLKVLSNCLQHSPEESLLLIHFMHNEAQKFKNSKLKVAAGFKSKDDRNKYEGVLCNEVIGKIGNNFGQIIQQMTNVLAGDAKDSGSNQLFKIAYDLLTPAANKDPQIFNDKKFW